MAPLSYRIGAGQNEYVACAIAPTPAPGRDRSSFGAPALGVLDIRDPLPSEGVRVDVPAGAPQVMAALRDAEGNVPAGVTVTVRQPDGTAFSQSTEPYDPRCVVQVQDGSLTDLLVNEPEAGEWTLQVESTNTEDEYFFFFSTLPTADVQDTINATLSSMTDPETVERMISELGESSGCLLCKLGCTALGIVLLALIAAGLTYITAGAAPIVALGAYLGISAQAAAALVVGITTGVSLSLRVVLTYICSWADACPSPAARHEPAPRK